MQFRIAAIIVAAFAGATASPRRCQAQVRSIALPDTLGANFSIADSARALGSLSDYNALLGHWHFRFEYRERDGRVGPPFTGHWSFEVKPGGGLMIDNWRPDDPSTHVDEGLYSIRLFDPEKKVWRMMGARSTGGTYAPGLTWRDANNLYAIQQVDDGLVRIRYFAIEQDRFLWRADLSTDGGRTWTRDYWAMEATRISK